jgi:hypothetical protein
MKRKLKYIKPYWTFETTSGFKPHFDKGDVVTDGKTKKLIMGITSTKDGSFYSGKNMGITINPENEYHIFNKNHTLIKKADLKTKYALSNDCNMGILGEIDDDDIISMALGEKPWHDFFENDWCKEWGDEEPQDIKSIGFEHLRK